MMVPCGIDKDPRLQPWMQQKYVNSHEVIWAVERMISRLSQKPKERFSIQDLTANLYNPHLPYRLLKELIIGSGFFDYNDAGVRYNWDLFDYFSKQNEEEESPNCSPIDPQSATNPTCARTSSSTNRRVKQNIDVDIDVDNNPPLKKEKEKKSEEDSIDEAAKSVAVSLCSTRCCSSRISEAEVRLIVASLGNPPFVEDLSESPKPDEL